MSEKEAPKEKPKKKEEPKKKEDPRIKENEEVQPLKPEETPGADAKPYEKPGDPWIPRKAPREVERV